MYIKWDNEMVTSEEVGNKAANLFELKRINISVPVGFVVTKKAFVDFVATHQLYDLGQNIGHLLVGLEMPDKMSGEINEACQLLSSRVKKESLFAVRSSSSREDLPHTSFAGMYETFLNVEESGVLKSIKGCWQSAFNPHLLSYLQTLGKGYQNIQDMAMGVIVQEMINSRFAGVLMTIDPISGDPSKILIEYAKEQLVTSGEGTPNRLMVDKITNQIDKINGEILEERYVYQLTHLAKTIEQHFGSYQDIEWAIEQENGELIILQTRPESVWNRRN
ncbi:MAG: PEP/pyruvate-binding domain-containing protein [bacterium]